jgi:beta-1,4-mannosyl-glycoprotein beta-1,4-N-acetylglucosaminyltransferase
MRKIVDGFIFYNELDMLEYRLNVLDDVVDVFILVESTHTHAGHVKPLFFEQNKQLYAKFLHKLVHIIVDDFPFLAPNIDYSKNEQWRNENWQRNCITRGISKVAGLNPQDIILCSDLDEIPNPDMLRHIKYGYDEITIHSLVQDFYYYNLNSKIVSEQWTSAKLMSYGTFQQLGKTFTDLRFYGCGAFPNAGWHLSYF